MRREIKTDRAPPPAASYSQGIVMGKTVYVAGQIPRNPDTGLIPESIEEQTRQCLENVKAILAAAGARLDHVAKTTVHLSELDFFPLFDPVYREYFKPPYPARTTVKSGLSGFKIEIDAVAELE